MLDHVHGPNALAEDDQLLVIPFAVLEQVFDGPGHAAVAIHRKGRITQVLQMLLLCLGGFWLAPPGLSIRDLFEQPWHARKLLGCFQYLLAQGCKL